jgi:alcohol oxidase
MLTGILSASAVASSNPTGSPTQHISIGNYTPYPSSRGRIHITHARSGYAFDTGFMDNELDVKKQVWAYKTMREIVRRVPYFAGELEVVHPKYPVGSRAALKAGPFAEGEEVRALVYGKEDDEAVEAFVREAVQTTWHSLGTCAMKARVEGGVVDGNLDV